VAEGGLIAVRDEPGLGVHVCEDAVAKYSFERLMA